MYTFSTHLPQKFMTCLNEHYSGILFKLVATLSNRS